MTAIESVAVVGYQACSEQDTVTPLEVFRATAMVLAGQIAPWKRADPPARLDVKLVTLKPGNITMQMGTQVVPDAVLDDGDLFDLLYVPGGMGSGAMSRSEALLEAIRRHAAAGKVIASSSSGVGIVFRSGILGTHPVTCQSSIARRLSREGANVVAPRPMWKGLPDAGIWTTTGSYGVNASTVALVSHYFGREIGTVVSMMFDTFGGIGKKIFDDVGPESHYHPEVELQFQDYFEPLLLTEPVGYR
jgi:putative intracellular protease/amidase